MDSSLLQLSPVSFIQSLFQDNKYETDLREPQYFISFDETTTYGITGIDLKFWAIAFMYLTAQSFWNIAVSIVIFYTIVLQRGTIQSYMIGYGIIIPTLLYMPFFVIEHTDIRNMAFLGCFAMVSPFLLSFRCMEAMHGFLPSFAYDEKHPKLSQLVLYFAFALQFDFDPQTEKLKYMTPELLMKRLFRFVRIFIESAILFSLLIPNNYRLFPSKEIQSLFDMFYWGNLANNYVMSYFTGLAMESGIMGMGIMATLITGIMTMEFNDNPMTASTSPSDFWSNRWNKIVGSSVRRGVYKPVRISGGYPRWVAALVTFVVQGLVHEYILVVMTLRKGDPNIPHEPFVPSYGKQFIFFVWNAFVLLGEQAFVHTAPIQWMKRNLPKPIRITLVAMTVVPVCHLFFNEYIDAGFYSDVAMGFPKIVKLQ